MSFLSPVAPSGPRMFGPSRYFSLCVISVDHKDFPTSWFAVRKRFSHLYKNGCLWRHASLKQPIGAYWRPRLFKSTDKVSSMLAANQLLPVRLDSWPVGNLFWVGLQQAANFASERKIAPKLCITNAWESKPHSSAQWAMWPWMRLTPDGSRETL